MANSVSRLLLGAALAGSLAAEAAWALADPVARAPRAYVPSE
jgi:hypothetical protein